MRVALFLCLCIASVSGCASEDWNNPRDSESEAYREACIGVPEDLAEHCMFWDDFSGGIAHWHVREETEPPRIVTPGQTNAPALELSACEGKATSVQIEMRAPASMAELVLWWRAATDSVAELAVALAGEPQQVRRSPLSADYVGWGETRVFLPETGTERWIDVRLWNREPAEECDSLLWIDRVYLERIE